MTSPTQTRTKRHRGFVIVAVAVYLALLEWVVLWKLDVPWIGEAAGLAMPIKLVPFVAAGEDGASKPNEMLINLVLFVTFGLFAGALAPGWSWWKISVAALVTSLILETVQHLTRRAASTPPISSSTRRVRSLAGPCSSPYVARQANTAQSSCPASASLSQFFP